MSLSLAVGLRSLGLAAFLFTPYVALSQITLTGAIQFSTDPSGAFAGNQSWNTLGGEPAWNLWLAEHPNGSSPINGPSDAQAGVTLSLSTGGTYQFYMFGAPDNPINFNGLNLFFNGNNVTPGISVFGATNSALFLPNISSGTRTLAGAAVAGVGSTHYAAGGAVAVLTRYRWNAPATPPGDVCHPFSFVPGGGASFFGSFTLQVFPEARLTLSRQSGPPGSSLTMTGTTFAAGETVEIYSGQLGSSPVATSIADSTGSFVVTARVPPHPQGRSEFFAVGRNSGRLGVANFLVIPGLEASPSTAKPGSSTAIQGAGFGAGETVSIYWNNPRVLLGAALTNANGSFLGASAVTVTVPINAPAGINAVIGIGQTTKALAVGQIKVQ